MGIFAKIKEGLKKTRDSMSASVNSMLSAFTKIDEDLFEEELVAVLEGGQSDEDPEL